MHKNHIKTFWHHRTIILTLLILGAALRLWAVGRVPPGLYHDEAQHGMDALAILQGGPVPLYFEANNGREPLFIYLVTLSVGVLGRSPLAVRLPSFFIGVLTLAAVYDLARVLWSPRIGRWALGVLTVTFWHVHLSRVGFRSVLLPLLTTLWMAQAARAIRAHQTRYWIAAGALYGASWYTYSAARLTPIAFGLFILYSLWAHRDAARQVWQGALIFCLSAFIILTPLGLYTLTHPDIVLRRADQVSVFSPEINQGNLPQALLRHLLRTLGMAFIRGDRIWRHNLAWRPVWGPALGLAFVVGLVVVLRALRRDARATLVVLWTLTMTIPTILAEDAPHFLRGAGLLPTLAFFPALGLAWLETQLPTRVASYTKNSLWPIIARYLPLLLLLIGLGSTTYDYFIRYANAPLAHHWFEAGPVELAGQVNALRGEGWDGEQMRHGPNSGYQIYTDRKLWTSWTTLPFLVPEEHIHLLPVPVMEPPVPHQPIAFVVWPYNDWESGVLPYLPHPGYLGITAGPKAQGDLDPEPYTIATFIQGKARPDVPEPVARFDDGIWLRAALVHPDQDSARVHLWWDADQAPTAPYTVFIHYIRDGERIAQDDAQPGYGHMPTTFWRAGDLILDEHPLSNIIPDPKRDTLRIGLYHSDTVEGLNVLDDAGNAIGTWIDLPVILSQ